MVRTVPDGALRRSNARRIRSRRPRARPQGGHGQVPGNRRTLQRPGHSEFVVLKDGQLVCSAGGSRRIRQAQKNDLRGSLTLAAGVGTTGTAGPWNAPDAGHLSLIIKMTRIRFVGPAVPVVPTSAGALVSRVFLSLWRHDRPLAQPPSRHARRRASGRTRRRRASRDDASLRPDRRSRAADRDRVRATAPWLTISRSRSR